MPTTWTPPASHCWSLPGFAAVDVYPVRSPLAVADFLAPRVAGKAVCEIGTRNGDIAACLAHHAASVTAIELDQEYCRKLRKRGLRVLCRPVEEVRAFAALRQLPSPSLGVDRPTVARGVEPCRAAHQSEKQLCSVSLCRRTRTRRACLRVFFRLLFLCHSCLC